MAEMFVNCPTCGGDGEKLIELLDVSYDSAGNGVGQTVDHLVPCGDCQTMGVIPGGPPA